MNDQREDPIQTRKAMAALFAAFAKALDGPDGNVSTRFEQNLEQLYRYARESECPSIPVMETLKWASELMRKV